jgi:hypothetical protein
MSKWRTANDAKALSSVLLPLLLSSSKKAMDCQQCQSTIIRTIATIIVAQASKGGMTDNATQESKGGKDDQQC